MFSLSYVNLEKDEVEIKNGFKTDKEVYDYIANHKRSIAIKAFDLERSKTMQ